MGRMFDPTAGIRRELVYLERQQELLDDIGRTLDRLEARIHAEIRSRGGLSGVRLG